MLEDNKHGRGPHFLTLGHHTVLRAVFILAAWKYAANLFFPIRQIQMTSEMSMTQMQCRLPFVDSGHCNYNGWTVFITLAGKCYGTILSALILLKPGEGPAFETSCWSAKLCPISHKHRKMSQRARNRQQRVKVEGHHWDPELKPVTESPLLGKAFEQKKSVCFS